MKFTKKKLTIEKILKDDYVEKAHQEQYLRASCVAFPTLMLYQVHHIYR